MAKKSKTEATKPPIKAQVTPAATAARSPAPSVASSTAPDYPNVRARASALPSIDDVELSPTRIQGFFKHLLMLSPREMVERAKTGGISMLEQQAIMMLLKTVRELPPQEEVDIGPDGNPILNPDGSFKKRLKGLHKDQLQNERQALEITKYFHERAYGKTKVTVEHEGLPTPVHNHLHLNDEAVLAAMDNLPPQVIDVIAEKPTKKKPKA